MRRGGRAGPADSSSGQARMALRERLGCCGRSEPVSDVSVMRATGEGPSASAPGESAPARARAVPIRVIETKLVRPLVRPGTVSRGDLLDRLTASKASSVVGVFAPAGYGKATLLAQSMALEQRPVARVSVDESDNDPVVLLLHVAVAVDRLFSLPPALFAMLASPGPFEPSAIHRVCSELSALPAHVLVLDDVHLAPVRLAATRSPRSHSTSGRPREPSCPDATRLACRSRGCEPVGGCWRSAPPILPWTKPRLVRCSNTLA